MTIIDYADFWMPIIYLGIVFAGWIGLTLTMIVIKMRG